MTSTPYRIVFMGTPQFAVPSLTALIDSGQQVVAVVCQPDRPRGRGRKLTPPPVKECAKARGLPVLQPEKIRTDAFLDQVRAFSPDLIVVAAYGRILPGPLLRLPALGTINVHGSLLPDYRGAAPIQWAILNGETETGITIMQMDEGLDTGDILLAEKLSISPDDTAATLAEKMAALGGALLVRTLDRLRRGMIVPVKQDDARATLAPPLTRELSPIDWQRPARAISCQIRGLDPWPTATTTIHGKRLKLFKPSVVERTVTEAPGTLCRADRAGLLIATGRNYLLAAELQLEGTRRMSADAFLRGRPLAEGTRLGS